MYNTVLGAKPLRPDGTAFYYSDYNFHGQKVYSNHRWPCCSGTLPQVAADYRLNTYFRDERGLYVNLYIPSDVKWHSTDGPIQLTQRTEYPFDRFVHFELTMAAPLEFALHLRIPAWTSGATLYINGKRQPMTLEAGTFASCQRRWMTGDSLDLEIPMTPRLESIDPQHPDIVALLCGPLVLFPITSTPPVVTRAQLLAATRTGSRRWLVESAAGPLTLLPFTEIADETYTTYLHTR